MVLRKKTGFVKILPKDMKYVWSRLIWVMYNRYSEINRWAGW